MNRDVEFFVGYTGRVPSDHHGRLRAFVLGALVGVPLVLSVVAWRQNTVEAGSYEYGVLRPFEGVLMEQPVPHLVTAGEGSALLVGFGKSGLPDFARGHSGKRVAFLGTLLEREGGRMIEMNDMGSFRVLGDAGVDAGHDLGRCTIVGELLDTKCFFGAMRPAVGKVHRACAIRCLGAGIPPAVRVVDGDGEEWVVLLAGRGDQPLALDVQWAGLAVEVVGEIEMHNGLMVMRADEIARLR